MNIQPMVILSLLLSLLPVSTYAATHAQTGTRVITTGKSTPHPIAQRVISLSPHATELAYSAGLGDKLIAVSEASDYPPAAKKLEIIANYQGIKLERILALKPDLIIAWSKSSYSREMQQVANFGIPIIYSSIKNLDDIPNVILNLSQWAEDPKIGKQNADTFKQQLTLLRNKHQNDQPIDYFLQLSAKPIISVSTPHWPSDIFKVCGGKNILVNTTSPYPQIGLERLITAKPQVIFTSNKQIIKTAQWQKWSQIPAVNHQFVWSLNPDWLNRPTMRSLKAIEQVCQHFGTVRKQINPK